MKENLILLIENILEDEKQTLAVLEKGNLVAQTLVLRERTKALDYLFSSSPKPKLILLDLKSPQLNGLEILKKIREDETTCNILRIMLTDSQPELILAGHLKNTEIFLPKPIDIDILFKLVMSFIEQKSKSIKNFE
jgi:two-component system response regulator